MIRLEESQGNHDVEVCRLAKKYSHHPIWSACPSVTNTVSLPKFTYEGVDYEPDVYLKQVVPENEKQPIDWIFEVETKDSIGIPHTEGQLRAFAEYARKNAARVIVLVPPEVVKEMRENLVKWKLNDVVTVAEWGY